MTVMQYQSFLKIIGLADIYLVVLRIIECVHVVHNALSFSRYLRDPSSDGGGAPPRTIPPKLKDGDSISNSSHISMEGRD